MPKRTGNFVVHLRRADPEPDPDPECEKADPANYPPGVRAARRAAIAALRTAASDDMRPAGVRQRAQALLQRWQAA